MTQRLRNAIATCVLAAFATGSAAATDERPTVAAVWKVREVDFHYRSSVAVFTCGALKSRVAAILRGIGARDDVDVKVDDCFSSVSPPGMTTDTRARVPANTWQNRTDPFAQDFEGRQQLVLVRVRALMPVEMTPEVIVELERDQSRRELVSRVTGDPAAKNDHAVMFPAQRQEVKLTHKSIGLEPAECELLEQMTSVIRRLGTRVVRKGFLCSRDSIARVPPQLTVEALLPVPVGTTRLPVIDGEGEPHQAEPASSDVEPESAGETPPK